MEHLKNLIRITVCLISFAASSFAQDYADVHFSCIQCTGHELRIEAYTPIRSKPVLLFSEKISESGIAAAKIPVDSSGLIWMSVVKGDTTTKPEAFYIEPGAALEVELADSTWNAKGALGQMNKHLARIQGVDKERNVVFRDSYNFTKAMDPVEIQTAVGQLKAYQEEIRAEIDADSLLSQKFKNLLHAANLAPEKGFELFLDLQKVFSRQHQLVEKADKIHASLADLPEHLIDKNMLLSGRYTFPLTSNFSFRLSELMYLYQKQSLHEKLSIYKYLRGKILENAGLATLPDYFLARSLASGWVLDDMTYEELENAYRSYKADYPGSPFQKELDEILDEYATLKPGAIAKDFEMVSPEGQNFRLSDFKGKLVYIDVWATWCVPCREEFKFSKALSTRYSGREDLIFLYVSIDSDADAWRRFLQENPDLKGIHGLQQTLKDVDPEAEKKKVTHLYKTTGVPHYILIDKNGNIIAYKAKRPSELVKSDYLDEFLQR